MNGNGNTDRKLAILDPVCVKRGCIALDDIERQVVEGGPHLINHLPRQNAEFTGWSLRNIYLPFALRLLDDFVRPTSGICGDATLDCAEVFRSTSELKFRRCKATDHPAEEYQNIESRSRRKSGSEPLLYSPENPLSQRNESTHEIFQAACNFASQGRIFMGRQKRELRIAAFLPEAHRETRGRAWVLPACAEN